MFRLQFYDHHQGSITVLVQLPLIGVHTSSYSGLWLYVVCASVRTMYLQYIARHHTEGYFIRTDKPTTYSYRPKYDEACTPISDNCTSTVIDP
jgi:hypothetical protein